MALRPNGIQAASIKRSGPLLDTRNELICSCGFKRDFGYMFLSAEREQEWHSNRCKGECIIVVSPAPPLDRVQMIKQIRLRSGTGSATLRAS